MCRSPASTAVACMPDGMRSVVVPGKAHGRAMVVNQKGGIGRNSIKYSRLVESDDRLLKGNLKGDQGLPVSHNLLKKQRSLQLSSSDSTDMFQVVVLRVSLHCQACAGKVKKHLSRMEGVTSFSIDLDTKKVTIRGQVSPTVVLESVSKIKKAEFWTC
ncbi:hypothetical protein BVRB_8g190260 [Beta vulgaris subsp. vulgaris]|nr:hypothetical protein BVRB_8g190260 [Beta vulgaris subsp. vulgaris]